MQRFLRSIYTAIGVGALLPGAATEAGAACSNNSLKGRWGVTFGGEWLQQVNDVLPGPGAGIATIVSAGDGLFSGDLKSNFNGTVLTSPVDGTYQVNPDCTGTATLNYINKGISLDLFFVITNKRRTVQFENTTLPGVFRGTIEKFN